MVGGEEGRQRCEGSHVPRIGGEEEIGAFDDEARARRAVLEQKVAPVRAVERGWPAACRDERGRGYAVMQRVARHRARRGVGPREEPARPQRLLAHRLERLGVTEEPEELAHR